MSRACAKTSDVRASVSVVIWAARIGGASEWNVHVDDVGRGQRDLADVALDEMGVVDVERGGGASGVGHEVGVELDSHRVCAGQERHEENDLAEPRAEVEEAFVR